MIEEFEQNVCAVVCLDDDSEPLLFLCAITLLSLDRVLLWRRFPTQHSQDATTSLVLSRGQQSCQDCTKQEQQQQDWPNRIGSPQPPTATRDPESQEWQYSIKIHSSFLSLTLKISKEASVRHKTPELDQTFYGTEKHDCLLKAMENIFDYFSRNTQITLDLTESEQRGAHHQCQ